MFLNSHSHYVNCVLLWIQIIKHSHIAEPKFPCGQGILSKLLLLFRGLVRLRRQVPLDAVEHHGAGARVGAASGPANRETNGFQIPRHVLHATIYSMLAYQHRVGNAAPFCYKSSSLFRQ